MTLNESVVEDAALAWLAEVGYAIGQGPRIAPGEPAAERDSFADVVLVARLREAIRHLAIPDDARKEAYIIYAADFPKPELCREALCSRSSAVAETILN